MCLCVRSHPNPLDHSRASPICSLPSLSLKYYIDMPIDNLTIYGTNVALGNKNNMFSMLGGIVNGCVPKLL